MGGEGTRVCARLSRSLMGWYSPIQPPGAHPHTKDCVVIHVISYISNIQFSDSICRSCPRCQQLCHPDPPCAASSPAPQFSLQAAPQPQIAHQPQQRSIPSSIFACNHGTVHCPVRCPLLLAFLPPVFAFATFPPYSSFSGLVPEFLLLGPVS